MLKIGGPAPELTGVLARGPAPTLKGLRGKKVVLYFYPKDMTPGCTQEACDFRDNMARLTGRGVIVIGVSADTPGTHTKFREKYDLNFELLSDPQLALTKTYGAFGDKVIYGHKVTGTIRSTFLIDERGRIAKIWSPVKIEGHVAEVLTAIRELDVNRAPPRPRPRPDSGRTKARSPRARRVNGAAL